MSKRCGSCRSPENESLRRSDRNEFTEIKIEGLDWHSIEFQWNAALKGVPGTGTYSILETLSSSSFALKSENIQIIHGLELNFLLEFIFLVIY